MSTKRLAFITTLVALYLSMRMISLYYSDEQMVTAAGFALPIIYGAYAGIQNDKYLGILLGTFLTALSAVLAWTTEKWLGGAYLDFTRVQHAAFNTHIFEVGLSVVCYGVFWGLVAGVLMKEFVWRPNTQFPADTRIESDEQRDKHEVAEP